jgi:hypothetical protein
MECVPSFITISGEFQVFNQDCHGLLIIIDRACVTNRKREGVVVFSGFRDKKLEKWLVRGDKETEPKTKKPREEF